MAMDLILSDIDGASFNEIIDGNGIQVEVKVVFSREALIAKIPDKKVQTQTTTRVNIDVVITGRNMKVVTKAGAFARTLQGFAGVSRKVKIHNAPPGTSFDAGVYTRALTMNLARQVLDAALREQSLDGHCEIGKSLDHLGDVAKHFTLGMNIMKMKIKGPEPYRTEEQCKMFCNTVLRVNMGRRHHRASARNAASRGPEKRHGVKVTSL